MEFVIEDILAKESWVCERRDKESCDCDNLDRSPLDRCPYDIMLSIIPSSSGTLSSSSGYLS